MATVREKKNSDDGGDTVGLGIAEMEESNSNASNEVIFNRLLKIQLVIELSSLNVTSEGLLLSENNGVALHSNIYIIGRDAIIQSCNNEVLAPRKIGSVGTPSVLRLFSFSPDSYCVYVGILSKENVTILRGEGRSAYKFNVPFKQQIDFIQITGVENVESTGERRFNFAVVCGTTINLYQCSNLYPTTSPITKLSLSEPPKAVTGNLSTLYFICPDGIFIATKADSTLEFLKAIESVYHAVGYSNTPTVLHPTNRLNTDIKSSLKILKDAVHTMKKFENQRISGTGRKSFGAMGFIYHSTLSCLYSTVEGLANLTNSFDHVAGLRNKNRIKIQAILSESWIEHSFGNITQSNQSESNTLQEYVQQKRKNEVRNILQNTTTPFVFEAAKTKDYAPPPISSLPASQILKSLHKPKKPLQDPPEPHTMANKEFLKNVWATTKGERSVSTRSKWRANWGHKPTTIDNASRKRKMDE